MYYLYILRSLRNGKFYIGCTKDIQGRLIEHNSGETKGNRYNRPFELVYKEEYDKLSDARKMEYYIKSRKSRKFIEELIKRGVAQFGLARMVRDHEGMGSNPISPKNYGGVR